MFDQLIARESCDASRGGQSKGRAARVADAGDVGKGHKKRRSQEGGRDGGKSIGRVA